MDTTAWLDGWHVGRWAGKYRPDEACPYAVGTDEWDGWYAGRRHPLP